MAEEATFRPITEDIRKVKVPTLKDGENYHAFISHSSEDIQFSHHLLEELEKLDFKCFHSDRNFVPGSTIVGNIMKGINESRRVVAIVSTNMLSSHWVEFEIANSRTKAVEKREAVFIPVLYDIEPSKVPGYIKETKFLEYRDDDFWEKLLYALTASVPLKETIPAGNIAHGLAWSYFYGYLTLVLPGITDRTNSSDLAKKGIPILPKMVIIFPETCYCPGDLKKIDENVTFEDTIGFKASRAGKPRDYRTSVYRVKDPDNGEEFFVLMEYATPLQTLYEMEMGRISELTREVKHQQMLLFKEKMKDILEHESNIDCRNKAVLVSFDEREREDGSKPRLSKVLADCVRSQLHRN